jgi:hypothetical protein
VAVWIEKESELTLLIDEDGKKEWYDGFEDIGVPTFSPDSRYFAVPIGRERQWTMLIEGEPASGPQAMRWFDEVGPAAFSPDSRCVAFQVWHRGSAEVIDKWLGGGMSSGPSFTATTKPVFLGRYSNAVYLAGYNGRLAIVTTGLPVAIADGGVPSAGVVRASDDTVRTIAIQEKELVSLEIAPYGQENAAVQGMQWQKP